MAYRKLSDKELEDKLSEFEDVIKASGDMPVNIGKTLSTSWFTPRIHLQLINFRSISSLALPEVL